MKKLLSRFSPTTEKVIMLFIVIILVGVLLFTSYAGAVVYTRKLGIKLTPSKAVPIREQVYYLQNDPEWSGDKIGNSTYTMGGHGCLVTSVASTLDYYGIPVTPGELNALLTSADGYVNGADLVWFKINELYPSMDYKYTRLFNSSTIEKDLEAGYSPIVKVKYKGRGIFHWLAVVGAKDGEFYVIDPLNGEKEPIPLSDHGNIYAYRTILPAE